MRYKYRKAYNWNTDIAYFAGLMASDGCLYNDGRHINITSKDLEIIDNVRNIVNASTKVTTKLGQYHTSTYNFTFGDVALYDFLFEAGITPHKSKTIQSVTVPDKYYPDFLRGLFDGDGTVYGYLEPYWGCHKYYVGFYSASYNFLLWLRKVNHRLLNSTYGSISRAGRVYILRYGKADSQILFNAMYYLGFGSRLTRKYLKLRDFISADPRAKITIEARVL